MKDILEKINTKYSFLTIFVFSLANTVLFLLLKSLDENNIKIGNISFFQLLSIINILLIFLFIYIYINSIEKDKKLNIFISIIIILSFLINIFGTIDLYFNEENIFVMILGFFNILPLIIILIFSYFLERAIDLLPINTNYTAWDLIYFVYIFINNIVISILIKKLIFKNNNKYILLTLYYLQSNICIINLISVFEFSARV
jgi:hypothetical protein